MGHQEIWSQAQSLFSQLGRMDSSTSSAFYNALTDVLWHFGQVGATLSVHLVLSIVLYIVRRIKSLIILSNQAMLSGNFILID
jgi:hypothetical protein